MARPQARRRRSRRPSARRQAARPRPRAGSIRRARRGDPEHVGEGGGRGRDLAAASAPHLRAAVPRARPLLRRRARAGALRLAAIDGGHVPVGRRGPGSTDARPRRTGRQLCAPATLRSPTVARSKQARATGPHDSRSSASRPSSPPRPGAYGRSSVAGSPRTSRRSPLSRWRSTRESARTQSALDGSQSSGTRDPGPTT